MLVATSVTADARVLRQAEALVDAGHVVSIIGKDIPAGTRPPRGTTFFTASGGGGLPLSSATGAGGTRASFRAARWMLLPEHRALSFRRWSTASARVAGGLIYDVVHAHDFSALPLGSRLSGQQQVPLVYDSHEMWSERRRSGRPTPVRTLWERRSEKALGSRADAVLTVGDGLAERLRSSYGWTRVSVVRNTFPLMALDPARHRTAPTGVVYAGRLAAGRDLDTVAAASRSLSLPVSLLGPVDSFWSARFDEGFCRMLPPVEVGAVGTALRSAGLALVTLEPGCGNHEIALPNKLFHAVSAGVPVVASDVGELARTVRAHGLGVLYRAGDPASLVGAVEEARRRYPELVAAVGRAAEELSWPRDRATLLRVYAGLVR